MSSRVVTLAGVAAAVVSVSAARGQLMIPDISRDRVMLFDAQDGSLINSNWLTDMGSVGWSFSSPKEARVVGREIWVSDQVADAVHRFTLERVFIGSITMHYRSGVRLDNVRGFGTDRRRVYLTVLANAAPDRGVVVYNYAGAPVAFYPGPGSYFDAEPFGGTGAEGLLVSSSTSGNIEEWVGGVPGTPFATGLPTPQQVTVQPDGSVITVAGIASAAVEGVYHFNADGTVRRFIPTEALKVAEGELTPRGAVLLGDGEYLVSTTLGVYKTDGDSPTGFVEVLGGSDAQHIVAMPTEPYCPCDWNENRVLDSQDYFDFLTDFFADNGDFNGDGFNDTQDFFDFLTCFFAGC